MNTVDTIIFDMDGLMFDTEKLYELAMDYAGEKMGIGKIGYLNTMAIGLSIDEARKIWSKELGESYKEELLRDYVNEFMENYYKEHGIPEKKGLQETIKFFKDNNYKLGLASSSSSNTIRNNLRLANLQGIFDQIIGRDMVEKAKPNPMIYREICSRLGELPENCYVLEDSKNGIRAAHGAGCKVIMIPDIVDADEEVEEMLFEKFESLCEVKKFFEQKL